MNRVFYDKDGVKNTYYAGVNKVFYDKDGNKLLIYMHRGILGYGLYGVVYKIGNDKCLKHVTNGSRSNSEVIEEIMKLDLESFYKIYKLLYDRDGYFSGYTMKYYDGEDIDILLMPTDYTLDNFAKLERDIEKISEKNIFVDDLHTENVILNRNELIVIDVDNYTFSTSKNLLNSNITEIYRLFKGLYIENMIKNYSETVDELRVIRQLFKSNNNIYDELKGYKYPIDYIKKKSLEPVKYVMKKGM